MPRKRKPGEPLVPPGSVNYALVKRGPVEKRRFRVGEVELARSPFSLRRRLRSRVRRDGVWRILNPGGAIQTDATARMSRRRDGELERQLGIARSEVVNLDAPRYRPPGEA